MHLQGGVAKDGARPIAGIDVSKERLDVCLRLGARYESTIPHFPDPAKKDPPLGRA